MTRKAATALLPVAGITLIALAVRVPLLSIGMWRDEAYTYFDILPATIHGVLARIAVSESNPPVFFVVMHAWSSLFGFDELALKTPPLLFGILTVPAVYALGRASGGRFVALWSAGFAALAPELAYYSQEVRPYSLAVLLTVLTVVTYWRALTTRRWDAFATWVVAATLLIYVQYTGLFVLAGLALATAYLAAMRVAIPWRRLVLAFAAVALLFSPWFPNFVHHVHAGLPWMHSEPLDQRAVVALSALAYGVPIQFGFDAHSSTLKLAEGIVVAAALCALAWGVHTRLRMKSGEPASRDITLALVGFSMIAGIAGEAWFSYGPGRYSLPFAALACIVFATLLRSATRSESLVRSAALLVLTGIACVVFNLATIRFVYTALPKSGIRELASDVATLRDPRTVYLVAPDYVAATFAYYTRAQQRRLYGFARWDHPEIFEVEHYAERWGVTDLVPATLERIDRLHRDGYRLLVVIRGERAGNHIHDQAAMHYSRTDDLVDALSHTYTLLRRHDAPGRAESAELKLFTL